MSKEYLDDEELNRIQDGFCQGVWVSRELIEILACGNISPNDLAVWISIYSLHEKGLWSKWPRGCYASDSNIASKMGIRVGKVQRSLKVLLRYGLVQLRILTAKKSKTQKRILIARHEPKGDQP